MLSGVPTLGAASRRTSGPARIGEDTRETGGARSRAQTCAGPLGSPAHGLAVISFR